MQKTRKFRKDAHCHGICGLLRSECWCGWQPKQRSPFYEAIGNAGRPKIERLFDGYELDQRDDDAPAWFIEAMLLKHEEMLTVNEFSKLFGTHPTQVRRWIDLGLIHSCWTRHFYYEDGKFERDFEGRRIGKKRKSNVKLKRYTCTRWLPGEEKRPSHRRIPKSELERCKFLKSRHRGCGREPRFKKGEAPAPEVMRWRNKGESTLQRIEREKEEFSVHMAGAIHASALAPESPEIDLSIFEEKEA